MISIILPTYNEAENIRLLIKQTFQALAKHPAEIIVVDDNSPDSTWKVVAKLKQTDNRIKLIRRINERGLTTALNAGLKQARGEIVGWLDADLSHPAEMLSKMVKLFPKNDAVIASRYVPGAADKRSEKLTVIFSRLINYFSQRLLYSDITDYTSGYILAKRKFLENYQLRGDYGEYFINLVCHLKKTQAKIKELPYIYVSRTYGQSKTTSSFIGFISKGKNYLTTVLQLWLKK